MKHLNQSRSAFPITGNHEHFLNGLTKREFFACQALKGLLAGGRLYDSTKKAVRLADSLIKELEIK